MSVFTDFLEEEIVLLVSLPYRVGLWMSHQDDDAGTERDDEREMRAMEAVLAKIASGKKQTPFLSAVAEETLTYKNLWPQWAAAEDAFLDDLKIGRDLVNGRLAVDNAANYRKGLIQVASSVALAYGEFGDSDDDGSVSFFGSVMNKISDRLTVLSDDPDNISPAEDAALAQLKEILQ